MADDLEKRLNDQKKAEAEKKARDRRKRMMARANARGFERINPLLVDKGYVGKSVLIDHGKFWGMSNNKKQLMDYYRQLNCDALEEGFPLIYQVNEKDAQRYLAEEQERQKARTARARKARKEEKPERKYSHPITAKTPRNERPYHAKSSQTSERPDDKPRKLPENDNRNVYKPVSLRSSNNISYKMADKKPEKKPEKKEEKKPEKKPEAKKPQERIFPAPKACQDAIAGFRGSYEDYLGSKPCHEAVINFGNLKSNPNAYRSLEGKIAQWSEKNKMIEDLFPRPRNADGTPGKYDENTLGQAAEYWYKTSKKQTNDFFNSNLEQIAFGVDDGSLRSFVERAHAPSKYDDSVKDLAESHKKYSELNDLFMAIAQSEDAGVKQAALGKIYDIGFKLFEEKMEKSKVDPELRSIFRDIFGYNQAVKMAKTECDARYKVFKGNLDKTNKPELADYFAGIAKDMTGNEDLREVLYNNLYGMTMPKEKKK